MRFNAISTQLARSTASDSAPRTGRCSPDPRSGFLLAASVLAKSPPRHSFTGTGKASFRCQRQQPRRYRREIRLARPDANALLVLNRICEQVRPRRWGGALAMRRFLVLSLVEAVDVKSRRQQAGAPPPRDDVSLPEGLAARAVGLNHVIRGLLE